MTNRVSVGGVDMELQEAFAHLETELQLARRETLAPMMEDLNATIRGVTEQTASKKNFELVSSIEAFDGERPETIQRFFENIDSVGDLCHWEHSDKLNIAKLKLTGAALQFIRTEDKANLTTYMGLKKSLIDRFSDKAPSHCYFQQLSAIHQRKGETIEAYADRVRALNEKTIRVTDSDEVNKALRAEGDRRALDAFLRGLAGNVGEQTRLKLPTSMREAITLAIAIENIIRPTGEVSRTAPERKVFQTGTKAEIVCYKCHKKGHVSRDCRGGRRSPPPANNIKCWACGRQGHMQRECRSANPPRYANQPSGNEVGSRGVAAARPDH